MPPNNCNSSLQLILNQIFARLEGTGQDLNLTEQLQNIFTITTGTAGNAASANTNTNQLLTQLSAAELALMTAIEAIDCNGSGGTVDLSAVMAALADIEANTPTDLTTVLALLNTINSNTSGLTGQIAPIGANVTSLQTTVGTINSNTSGLTGQIAPIGANVTSLQTTVGTINTNTSGLSAQVAVLQAKVDALYTKQFPTPALELKFNTNTYTDAAGTVAGGLNALIMGWKDTIGSPLFIQPVAGALRPTRVVDGISFNGANILQILTPAVTNWAAGNFTLEWYANQATTSGTPISISINGSSYCGFVVMGHTIYLANAAGTGWAVSGLSLGSLIANTWTHYAIVKEGGVLRTYRGGVQQATLAYTDTMYHLTTNYSYLGAQRSGQGLWTGKLTDLRIYNSCIYPGGQNFTPPTRST